MAATGAAAAATREAVGDSSAAEGGSAVGQAELEEEARRKSMKAIETELRQVKRDEKRLDRESQELRTRMITLKRKKDQLQSQLKETDN